MAAPVLVQPSRPGVLASRQVRTTPAGTMQLSERYSPQHTTLTQGFPWAALGVLGVAALLFRSRGGAL
jgi:hypothetical protein